MGVHRMRGLRAAQETAETVQNSALPIMRP
jgi:hypothetical protein